MLMRLSFLCSLSFWLAAGAAAQPVAAECGGYVSVKRNGTTVSITDVDAANITNVTKQNWYGDMCLVDIPEFYTNQLDDPVSGAIFKLSDTANIANSEPTELIITVTKNDTAGASGVCDVYVMQFHCRDDPALGADTLPGILTTAGFCHRYAGAAPMMQLCSGGTKWPMRSSLKQIKDPTGGTVEETIDLDVADYEYVVIVIKGGDDDSVDNFCAAPSGGAGGPCGGATSRRRASVLADTYERTVVGTGGDVFDFKTDFESSSREVVEAVYAEVSTHSKTAVKFNGVESTGGSNGYYYIRPATLETNDNAGVYAHVLWEENGSDFTYVEIYDTWGNLKSSCTATLDTRCLLLEKYSQPSHQLTKLGAGAGCGGGSAGGGACTKPQT